MPTHKMGAGPTCPKLKTYWQFNGCRYDKISRTCAEPDHIEACPLPSHDLRNGRLNQTAYSLYLFIRDLAAAGGAPTPPKRTSPGDHGMSVLCQEQI
jgi:hypothetical protein